MQFLHHVVVFFHPNGCCLLLPADGGSFFFCFFFRKGKLPPQLEKLVYLEELSLPGNNLFGEWTATTSSHLPLLFADVFICARVPVLCRMRIHPSVGLELLDEPALLTLPRPFDRWRW